MASQAIGSVVPHIGLASIVGQFAAATYETIPAKLRHKIGAASNGIGTNSRIEVSEGLTQFKAGDRPTEE